MLNVIKSADKSYIFCGMSNKIKYSIIITNNGTTPANCVKVKDVLSPGLCLIPHSIMINGCQQNVLSLENGVTIGSIPPGGNTILTFDVEVPMDAMLTQVENQAMVTYCDGNGVILTAISNNLIIPVYKIFVCITKTAEQKEVLIGEVINYSILIRNESNLPIDNAILYDDLPTSLKLLPGTVMVNLASKQVMDFSTGLLIGTIPPHAGVVVSFQAQVINYPSGGVIENTARVEYNYTIIENNIPNTSEGEACSCKVVTEVINDMITC